MGAAHLKPLATEPAHMARGTVRFFVGSCCGFTAHDCPVRLDFPTPVMPHGFQTHLVQKEGAPEIQGHCFGIEVRISRGVFLGEDLKMGDTQIWAPFTV